jgi:uncharacterized membrane protein YfcA
MAELYIWLLYGGIGLAAGVVAGLLGVGGGVVVVPALSLAFMAQGLPDEFIMHMALGTSLGTIIFTSISSAWAHHKKGAVLWYIMLTISPGILVGTFLGTRIASYLSTGFLGIFFCVFLYAASVQLMFGAKPKATREMPKRAGLFGVGSLIGAISALVGIGGGTISVPFMVWHNVSVHKAVATASAIGLPIALAGTTGYIMHGWGQQGLPEGTLGYIYIPALIGVSACTILTAPVGAWLAHRLPAAKLKRVFAVFLILMATRMLWKML